LIDLANLTKNSQRDSDLSSFIKSESDSNDIQLVRTPPRDHEILPVIKPRDDEILPVRRPRDEEISPVRTPPRDDEILPAGVPVEEEKSSVIQENDHKRPNSRILIVDDTEVNVVFMSL